MIEVSPYRKRDFHLVITIDHESVVVCEQFSAAVIRIRPSRLDNLVEIEVGHQPDQQTHQTIQGMCDRGITSLIVRTVYPISGSPVDRDARSYMQFVYETGKVINQWTEMSRDRDDGDELMPDVIKIAFDKKTVTNCVWAADPTGPSLILIPGGHPDTLQ